MKSFAQAAEEKGAPLEGAIIALNHARHHERQSYLAGPPPVPSTLHVVRPQSGGALSTYLHSCGH
jgi:hypothetical protein